MSISEEEYNKERDLQQKYESEQRKILEEEREKTVQSFRDRFFEDTTYNQDQIKVFRIIKGDYDDTMIEEWSYMGIHYYGVKYSKFSLGCEKYQKEITKIEFYHKVAMMLNKMGILPKIIEQSDH